MDRGNAYKGINTFHNRRDTMENPNNKIIAVGSLDGDLQPSL